MFSLKTITFAAAVAFSAFASAAPVAPMGGAAASSAAAVTNTAVAVASAASGTAVAITSTASQVKGTAVAAAAGATSSASAIAGSATRAAAAAQKSATSAVGRALVEADADADVDVELLDTRHDQTLLGLVDQAIVDLTETCQALLYLQPANATEQAVSELLGDVKLILGDLLTDVKALTGLDVSAVLGDVTDVNSVGKIVADLLKLVFTALGGVLNVLGSAPADVISHLLQDICVIIAELLKVIFGLVDGVLGLVGGLLGVVVGLLGDILPIVLQLNVSVLVQVLVL
ncbi:hypothetical protein K525DRAFT_363744 [Schizophyllum commune Loenen D]|nr:hypothetical protein K525DRAFT_363744 [Schizophyllum commune Loenen D]